MIEHRASGRKESKLDWPELIGRFSAAALVAALFVAGIWALESDPPRAAPHGPAG
jgi:hypothetical protein